MNTAKKSFRSVMRKPEPIKKLPTPPKSIKSTKKGFRTNNNNNKNKKPSEKNTEKEPESLEKMSVGYTYIASKTTVVPTSEIKTHEFIRFNKTKLPKPMKQSKVYEFIPYKDKKNMTFDDALFIYDVNQSYFLDILDHTCDRELYDQTINEVKEMEKWFCNLREPKPPVFKKDTSDLEAWTARQLFKKQNGYSKYFDPELLAYVDFQPSGSK